MKMICSHVLIHGPAVARSPVDFELTAEVFMPIRITPLDKSLYMMQAAEIKGLAAAHLDESTVYYAERKLKFGILCVSS